MLVLAAPGRRLPALAQWTCAANREPDRTAGFPALTARAGLTRGRRHTRDGPSAHPGLRREEVAQLAGIGITWYTWLEQGRPINVSSQVLDAVARTLFLSAAEREHLYRLAEVPQPPAISDPPIELPDHLDSVLGALDPLPAMLVDGRTDVLRWNRAYAALHPALVSAPPGRRNTLWQLFAAPEEQPRIVNREEQAPEAVAGFRYRYSQNAGDARWQDFVARLCTASPLFSRLWATHDVAPRTCATSATTSRGSAK